MVHHLVTSISSRQRIFPVTGMGGCGKTQTVSYFLQEYPLLYTCVVFVDASSSVSIQSDMQTWVQAVVDGDECGVLEDAIRIPTNVPLDERWLLILDNADDPKLNLVSFIPQSPNLTVIITSRNRDLGNLSTTYHLELGEMEEEEALATLLQAARRESPLSIEEMKSASALMKELGYLAVALVQAGTYCHQLSSHLQPYTFTQYLSLFYAHRAELMRRPQPFPLDSYEQGAYTTLDLSYQVLSQEDKEFLHFISFFHRADIPVAALATAARKRFADAWSLLPRPEGHERIVADLLKLLCAGGKWNDLQVQQRIRNLRCFSLLSSTPLGGSVFLQLHPLIQSWSRDMVGSDSQHYRAMSIQSITSCDGYHAFPLHRYILPHILDILVQIEVQELHVNDLVAIGEILRDQGDYQKASALIEVALEKMANRAEQSTEKELEVTGLLAAIYWSEGRWDEAEKLEFKVLEQRREILGIEHLDTILAAGNLASTYSRQGRHGEAEKLELEVLEWRRGLLGLEHPDTIFATANLASTYSRQGRHGEAEKLELEVLERRRRILGPEHPDTIFAAANLVSTYSQQGRRGEAEVLEVEMLEQERKIGGIEHPDTLKSEANLAVIYRRQGQYSEAEKLELEILKQRRGILGLNHPDTIQAAENLAWTYWEQGRYAEAEKLELEVLERRRSLLGADHPDTITAAGNLARTYSEQARYSEAETLEKEVFEKRRRILGADYPGSIVAAANLAATYGAQSRWGEDLDLLAPAVKRSEEVLGRQHPITQRWIKDLVYVYEILGQEKEAAETRSLLIS